MESSAAVAVFSGVVGGACRLWPSILAVEVSALITEFLAVAADGSCTTVTMAVAEGLIHSVSDSNDLP